MTREEAPELRSILLVLAAMFAFSLMAVFTRGAQANILGVAAWRAIIVAAVFAISAIATEGGTSALKPDAVTLKLGAWLGLALAIASSTFVGGYALTTVANTIFLHNLAPLMVFPLAWWLFKERAGAASVTGASVALFGVAMLSGVSLFQVSHFASSRFLLGDFLAFISAIGYAAVLVLTRMTRNENTPILGTLFVAWSVAAALLTVVALVGGGFSVPAASMVWIFGLAIVCTNIPFYLLNLGMRRVPAGMAAVLSLSEVLFATGLGLVVYGERLAPIGWMGAALAGVGVLYAVTQRNSPEQGAPSSAEMLPESVRTSRVLRSILGLVLLNLGAVCTIADGWSAAPLVALLGLGFLARYGPGVALVLLDGRFQGALRWMGAGLGAVVAWSALQWAGSLASEASLGFGIVSLGVLALDRHWSNSEAEADRDHQPLLQLALGLFGISLILGHLGHGLATLTLEAANLLICLSGLVAVLSALVDSGTSARPGLDSLEAPALRWMQGRRPIMAIGIIWALGAVHTVPTGHIGIIERFGEPVGQTEGAGLVLRLPPPFEMLTQVDLGSERQLNIDEHTLLTGDQSMISLAAVTRFSVKEPQTYAYNVADPDGALVELARSALIEVVAREDQDALLTTGRTQVEQRVLRALQVGADNAGLGISVSGFHLTTVTVPAPVMASFLDVITANEERLTRINLAEAYEARLLPQTRGSALERISEAQGEAAQIDATSTGYHEWFKSISQNGRRAPRLTAARIAAETMEAQLSETRLIAAPANVRVWLGNEGHWPRDPNAPEGE